MSSRSSWARMKLITVASELDMNKLTEIHKGLCAFLRTRGWINNDHFDCLRSGTQLEKRECGTEGEAWERGKVMRILAFIPAQGCSTSLLRQRPAPNSIDIRLDFSALGSVIQKGCVERVMHWRFRHRDTHHHSDKRK